MTWYEGQHCGLHSPECLNCVKGSYQGFTTHREPSPQHKVNSSLSLFPWGSQCPLISSFSAPMQYLWSGPISSVLHYTPHPQGSCASQLAIISLRTQTISYTFTAWQSLKCNLTREHSKIPSINTAWLEHSFKKGPQKRRGGIRRF